MKITGTFLDEITYDIPSQNWGRQEWDRDFQAMKSIGIDTVILIRCGLRKWMTYPSKVLAIREHCHSPSVDLVRLFLDLAGKHGMSFYFGTYDSGSYWQAGQHQKEVELNKRVVEEVWSCYGGSPAFKGWYLTQEVSRKVHGIIDIYAELGKFCKSIANLPVLISPYIEGCKAGGDITARQHAKEWDEIMSGIHGAVDKVAFQDGHVDFGELFEFLSINKALADKHGLDCWTNSETFDRDMPIKFLPINWEKLRFKLEAANLAGYQRAITFEFSHFLSPHSSYHQAHGLFRRYSEYIGCKPTQV